MAKLKLSANWHTVQQTATALIIEEIKRTLIPKIRAAFERYYSKTFQYWTGLGIYKQGARRTQYPVPFMYFNADVKVVGKEIRVVINTMATFGGGVPNKLWYWLDKGTPAWPQTRTSPPIPRYTAIRTSPDTLDVKPSHTLTDGFFVVKAGTMRKGIPPRNWSRLIGKFATADLQDELKSAGMTIKRVVINGRKLTGFD